ncbi:protein HESO1 isoform X2 [Typha latifolia]|uniref:protein HESO1 isoform X2 n=1 Tax=Typha latifolia TaxID=4733 RepID=UPI003C2C8FB5
MMDYYYSRSTKGVTNDTLELCLREILSFIKPMEVDQVKRVNTINELAASIGSIATFRGAAVKPFGSYVSELYSKWGDLDISINLPSTLQSSPNKRLKQNVLRELMKYLRKRGVAYGIQFIPKARVPLLIYKSVVYDISCDISINNHLGRIKSKILHWITELDERFGDMVLLIKEWAKAQEINNPKSGTLNSYSLCLLVIFHFQTCVPAILPPLREIYEGNIVDDVAEPSIINRRQIKDICTANIRRFRSRVSRARNKSSLFDLLVSFFAKFTVLPAHFSERAICTYTGRWEDISRNPRWTAKPHAILVEDPFERPDNAARAVGLRELSRICNAFNNAYLKLCHPEHLDKRSLLAILTRPSIYSQLSTKGSNRHNPPVGNLDYVTHQRVETLGHITHEHPLRHVTVKPIHDQFHDMLKLDERHQASSSSTFTSQSQGAMDTRGKHLWVPRHSNR